MNVVQMDAELRRLKRLAIITAKKEKETAAQPSPQPKVLFGEVQVQAGDTAAGWTAITHEESGRIYFWNQESNKTVWKCPPEMATALHRGLNLEDPPSPHVAATGSGESESKDIPPATMTSDVEPSCRACSRTVPHGVNRPPPRRGCCVWG